jgi:hypothetical protein
MIPAGAGCTKFRLVDFCTEAGFTVRRVHCTTAGARQKLVLPDKWIQRRRPTRSSDAKYAETFE